jgi:PTH1 family peptidyl-tRNA hydrolase
LKNSAFFRVNVLLHPNPAKNCVSFATISSREGRFAILAPMKFLIAGLGNIGAEYDATRHNIGFDIADVFVLKHGGNFSLERHAWLSVVKWKGKSFYVIKPTTYMNLSGKAVKYWMDKEKIPLENILVLVDEIALPIDTLRLRAGGSDAGHNGLKSITEILQTDQYPRLRFGVGNDFPKGRQVEHVLGRWKTDELPIVKDKIMRAVDIIESFATQGIAKTMSLYNK